MTALSRPDAPAHGAGERSGESQQRGRGRYLPSAQVLAELAVLGPDLARLAADLRDRLSEQSSPSAT